MADRSITLSLKANVDGFVNKMRAAKDSALGLAQATSKTADDSEGAARRIAKASDAVAKAQAKAEDAAGRLRVAQAQLAKVQDSGDTLAVTRATEALAKAQRDSETAAQAATDAQAAYRRALKETSGQARSLGEELRSSSEGLADLGGMLAGAGMGVFAGFGSAVKVAADFDKAMSGVRAATHETDSNMALLGEAAKKAGADTAYSAKEAAQGIEELAKAGVETKDILGGGLSGALSLAAAGSMEVGDAAELAASTMTQFKLSGKDIPHIADLLAAGAGKAQGSVKDMGDALNQTGLIAKQSGLELEETAGGLAAFASAGLTGSDAGTSFKTMLQRLNPTTKEAKQQFDELGISAYDSQGNFVGLANFAGQLKSSMSGMSEQARSSAMNIMFGSDAVRAAGVLFDQGAEGIQEWTEKVNDAGYAMETAAIMQDNLAGDFEKFTGSIEAAFLKAGTGANSFLRGFVQDAEDVVDMLGSLPDWAYSAGSAVAGVGGMAMVAAGGFMVLAPRLADSISAMATLRADAPKTASAISGLSKAGAAATALAALAAVAVQVHNAGQPAAGTLEQMVAAMNGLSETDFSAIDKAFDFEEIDNGQFAVRGLADALDLLDADTAAENINNFGASVLGIDNVSARAKDGLDRLDQALSNTAPEKAAEKMRQLRAEMEAAGRTEFSNWKELQETLPQYASQVQAAANATGQLTSEADLYQAAMGNYTPAMKAAMESTQGVASSMGDLAEAMTEAQRAQEVVDALIESSGINPDGLKGAAEAMGILASESEEAKDKLDGVIDALFRAGLSEMSAQQAAAGFQEALEGITAAAEENGRTLDIHTEAGRKNLDAVHGMAQAGMDTARAYAEAGKSQGEMRDVLVDTYQALVDGYVAMGQSADAADTLARELLGIPAGVSITTAMDQEARLIAEATQKAIDAIPGYKGVEIAVSDNGTAGSIQAKIDEVTGEATAHVFVTTDGTEIQVQEQIRNIQGVDRTVYVDDAGTVYGTQAEIDGIQGKVVDLTAQPQTDHAEGKLNETARARDSQVTATPDTANAEWALDETAGHRDAPIEAQADTWQAIIELDRAASRRVVEFVATTVGGAWNWITGREHGGIAGHVDGGRLPGFSTGGMLPTTGLGTDQILAVTGAGMPIARVDDGEWIINAASSRKYNRLLAAINRDDPQLASLRAYAAGGMHPASTAPSWSSWAPTVAPQVTAIATAPAAPALDPTALAAVVTAATRAEVSSWRPVWQIGTRDFAGLMREADNHTRGR